MRKMKSKMGKQANDTKARGKGMDPKKPMTKNNVKGLMKSGKGK